MSRALRLTYALSGLGFALVLSACSGDDQADSATDGFTSATEGSASTSASTSASASATESSALDTDPATATASTTATATEGSASATEGSASATEGSASATEGSASATDSSASATEGSASATDSSASETEGSASAADTDSDSDSDGTATDSAGSDSGLTATDSDSDSDSGSGTDGCPEGAEGCPCIGGESCDGDLVCDNGACVVDVVEPVCGNGIVEVGEECDDGDDDDLDGCTSQCEEAPVCPAGTEDCPCDGNSCDQGLSCEGGTCVKEAVPVCGNGILEQGEACDDGNNQIWDECDKSCKLTSFGADPCGFPEDGVWLDINYKSSGSCYSPSWKFSATAGFGEAEWAPTGESWPVINAKGGPVINKNDPYGTVCDVGSSKWIRIMFGLASLSSYESATVCLEGRSISVGSPVTVDLVNPDGGDCGAQVQLSQAWTADPAGAELPLNCLKPGDPFQALQIDPSGGSSHLGLRSARITLHKPVF